MQLSSAAPTKLAGVTVRLLVSIDGITITAVSRRHRRLHRLRRRAAPLPVSTWLRPPAFAR